MVNMNELKVYVKPLKTNVLGQTIVGQSYYLKSEADKVIAEKDEKIEELEEHIGELQKATDSAWRKVNVYYDELRHSNRKRCLAMAKWCSERVARIEKDYAFWRHGKDYASNFYKRWQKRWLELAEEPTWEKFLQLIHKEAK